MVNVENLNNIFNMNTEFANYENVCLDKHALIYLYNITNKLSKHFFVLTQRLISDDRQSYTFFLNMDRVVIEYQPS